MCGDGGIRTLEHLEKHYRGFEAVCVFRVTHVASRSVAAGWFAVLLLVTNPGWLYLSMTRHATFTGTAANPECHQELIAANGAVTRCGSGSHTVPIWVNPEWAPSVIRRAIDRCDRASAYSWGRP